MTRIAKIVTAFSIRVNPRNPCNPCSLASPLHAEAPEIRDANNLQVARTINLHSSAFICGWYFAEAPYNKDSDRINMMDRIIPSANPVNPVHPVRSSLSTAPDIDKTEFIKSK